MTKVTDVKRPLVGRIDCNNCGEVAGLYKARRGKLTDLLYKRCGCGCDQRTGAAVQKRWRENMQPESGYEYLKITGQQPDKQPEPEPDKQPEPEPIEQPKQPSKKGLLFVLAAFGAGVLAITRG